jgi:hypothetical protein
VSKLRPLELCQRALPFGAVTRLGKLLPRSVSIPLLINSRRLFMRHSKKGPVRAQPQNDAGTGNVPELVQTCPHSRHSPVDVC